MRKIERQMNFAISNKGNWGSSNTRVEYNNNTNCSSVYLHGHQIATFDHNLKAVKLSSCGYETNTTKSRLNAILDEVKYGANVYNSAARYGLNVDTILSKLQRQKVSHL